MIILRLITMGVLRAPEGGEGGGGSPAAAAAPVIESHDDGAADAAFATPQPASSAASATDPNANPNPAGGEQKPASAVEAQKPKTGPSIFQKKPAAGEQKPAGAAEERIELDLDKADLHGNAAPQTKEQFAKVKAYAKQLAADVAKHQSEIAELRKNPGDGSSKELETLRAEHKALSDRLAVLDLQNHPKFLQQFVEPKNKIISAAAAVLAENQIAGVDLGSLVSKPRGEFMKSVHELSQKLPEYERSAFVDEMRKAYSLEGESRTALSDAAKLREQLAGQHTERARQAFEKVAGEFTVGLDAIQIADDVSAEDRTALEAYNAGLKEIRANAEKLAFSGMDEAGTAGIAMKAATLDFMLKHAVPRMEKEYREMAEMVTTLTGEIQKLKGARRGGEGGGGGGDTKTAPASHEDAAGQVWTK